MPYDGMDPELSGMRYKAWEKLRAYNDSVLRESEKTTAMPDNLFGKTGKNVCIERLFIAITRKIYFRATGL